MSELRGRIIWIEPALFIIVLRIVVLLRLLMMTCMLLIKSCPIKIHLHVGLEHSRHVGHPGDVSHHILDVLENPLDIREPVRPHAEIEIGVLRPAAL